MFAIPRLGKLTVLAALLGLFVLTAPTRASDLPDYTPNANDTRDQVPDAYKWSLILIAVIMLVYYVIATWNEETDKFVVEL